MSQSHPQGAICSVVARITDELISGACFSAQDIWMRRRRVFKTLEKVRKNGFAFMKSIQFAGLQAMSFPIFDLRGHAIAALSVPYVARLDDQ